MKREQQIGDLVNEMKCNEMKCFSLEDKQKRKTNHLSKSLDLPISFHLDLADKDIPKDKAKLVSKAKPTNRLSKAKLNSIVEKEQQILYLIKKFNSPESRFFYKKCVRVLPWGTISDFISLAFRHNVENAGKYFGRLATDEMKKRGE